MSDNYKKEIEKHAKDYFKNLGIGLPEHMIGRTISYFEFHLSKEGLVDTGEYEICHSDLLDVPRSLIVDIEDLAFGVARIYGTRVLKFVKYGDKKVSYYIGYVGYRGDVHACMISLKKLIKIAKDIKKEYTKSLRKGLKKQTREDKISDFMYEWVENLSNNLGSTALTGDDYSEHDEYIEKTFTDTEKEYFNITKNLSNFAEILIELTEENKNATNQEAMELFESRYGKSLKEVLKRGDYLQHVSLLTKWNPLKDMQ
ncbi:hypothetical protein IB655_08825 [Francisella noatunensis]|uniref:Uncharacterized protein n=1 Tax=Francisella noatunensis TaxID=657445 RepID=A0A9Q2KWG5_9GAMM|nr:hypothetical protein [Francisella noatunensis]MBK2029393.1 hypothetical protein [Francisella noatunensis]MBK2034009.1 hypothetical protein [Francisella noatunensis]MBK2049422.1 hypothetical protein [Francisella noatunensis]MBK2052302.1 hypothetical protein [Francisella noatunensis]MBK2053741.1 hypothetical protein [Francisella noatunensis]